MSRYLPVALLVLLLLSGAVTLLVWQMPRPCRGVVAETTDTIPWQSSIPCIEEEMSPVLVDSLDAYWVEAKQRAEKPGHPAARPRFCFAGMAVVIVRNGKVERLLGHHDPSNGKVLVALANSEVVEWGECVVLHEMLHAILGKGEERIEKLLQDVCPQVKRP